MYLTICFLVVIIVPVPVMIQFMRSRMQPYQVVLRGIISAAVGAIIIIILASVTGNHIFAEMQESVKLIANTLADNPALSDAMGMTDQTRAERIALYRTIYGAGADIIPGTICICAAVAAYIEYIILSKIIKPEGNPAIPMPKFREFNLPKSSLIGWVVIYFLSWLISVLKLLPNDLLYLNIGTLFDFVFCLQGISLLFQFCYRKRAPKVIAIILIFLLLLSPIGKLLLVILGVADLALGIKKRLR